MGKLIARQMKNKTQSKRELTLRSPPMRKDLGVEGNRGLATEGTFLAGAVVVFFGG
jgi:hypothetical protein